MQQDGPILFVAKDKSGQFLIMRNALLRTHGNYRQASFHHAHMIHVRYFDNFICGWTDAWVLPFVVLRLKVEWRVGMERQDLSYDEDVHTSFTSSGPSWWK